MRELNEKQKLFCHEYIKDLNAAQAAIRAGYSEKTARQIGSKLLTNIDIASFVQSLADQRVERVKVDTDTILKELLKMATVDITQAFTNEGWLKPLEEIPDDVRRAISGLEVAEMFAGEDDQKSIIGVNKKIKFYDKIKSLELLGKHLKIFTDKVEVSVTDNLADRLTKAIERASKN